MAKRHALSCLAVALIGSAVALHAAEPVSISVNFTGIDGGGIDDAQATSLLPEELAGAPGYAQTNWNNLARYGDITSGIKDFTGTETGLHLHWDAVWCHSSGAYSALGTPDGKLMDGMDDIDWGGGPPGPFTAGSIYGAAWNQKAAQYVSGLQSWLAAKGSPSYSVVLYVQGWHGWTGASEHWVQAAGGNPSSWTMSVGADLTPHMFSRDIAVFNGTYTQIASSCTNLANASTGGNFIVFNGLTNDTILIRTAEPTGDYQAGKIFGFQIVATPPTPITTAPQISPSPAYALSPVTLTEEAASMTPMTYQWLTDGGSGGSLTNIPDATNATIVVIPEDQATTYMINYACVVANMYGTVTSVVSQLTVNAATAPVFGNDTTPLNIYAFAGGSVTFNANFVGTQPMTNQWQGNTGSGYVNIGLTTTTNKSLVLSNLQLTDSGSYQLTATNMLGGNISTPATLTVQTAPPAPVSNQAYAYNLLTKTPLAYWRLNEVVDTTTATYQAYDASGNNRNAIYGSGVTTGNAGPQSPALVGFEDTNTAAGFTQSTANGALVVPPLNLSSSSVTLTAWIYPTANSPTSGGLLMNRTPTSGAGLGFGSNTDTNESSSTYGQAELGYNWNNNPSAYNFHSGLFPPLNVWSFVALTITPSNAVLYLCYSDGTTTNVLKKINNVANSLETFASGTTWLGGEPSNNNRIFNGFMDEVAVFGSALSDEQVLNLFSTAQGSGVVPAVSQQPLAISGLSSVSTFAGQTVSLTAYGIGYPAPGYQWQGGTGGVFNNLSNDGHRSGVNSDTLTIQATTADSMDYRLVLTNAYGAATSSVATVSIASVPANGIWTANFGVVVANNGAPTTPYSGPGVLGSGTFWNALQGGLFANSTSFRDDGATPTGISIYATNGPGSWYIPNPQSPLTKLLDPYVNTQTAFVITNLPNGTYNLAVFTMSGTYLNNSRGTAVTVNGITKSNAFQQDWMFAPDDNTALFTNVHVTQGSLLLDLTPIGMNGVDPNTEPDFNGVQIQAVSIDPVTVTSSYSGGTLTLDWANYGTLLSATNVTGPWVPVTGAVSPYQVSTTNAAMFFRVTIP